MSQPTADPIGLENHVATDQTFIWLEGTLFLGRIHGHSVT
jgi:hypothetical protein